ncbi:MAG: tyrosine-type recombinase/integrase [Stenotrophobium sp.]
MDRTGISSKRGHCQLSFVYLGDRYRIVLPGLLFERPSDRKAAARILASAKRDIDLGKFYFPDHFPDHPAAARFRKGHQIKIGDALRQWLLAKRPTVEPTTYHGYEKDTVYHLLPNFGEHRLSELRTSDVEQWLQDLDVCGKTKNNILIPLRSVFRQAFRDEKIERDPIEKIPLFQHRAKEPDPLSCAEIEAVLNACEGQIQNIIEFAIWTGLRTSELIAVRWTDADLTAGKVHVRLTRTRQSEKSHGKTATAMRAVDLHPQAREALLRQQQYTQGKTFVFDNPRTGEPWKHDGPYRKVAWAPALAKAGVKYRPAYQSRHTFASMLLSAGVEPMYVAQQMGHRDWGMIRKVYGRWMPEHSQTQQARIAAIWAPTRHQNHAKA